MEKKQAIKIVQTAGHDVTAFYCGWPKAWAAFHMAKEIWADNVK